MTKEEVQQLRLGIVTPFSQVYGTEVYNSPGSFPREPGEQDSSDVCFKNYYITVTDVEGKSGYVGVSVAVMLEGDIEHEGQLFSDRDTALAFIRSEVKL
ncbi:MAG: hypothetical protein LAO23_04555 [Acidobacteriia bacterium]|nr:hypothetical protein [Terriglobia bacterium]